MKHKMHARVHWYKQTFREMLDEALQKYLTSDQLQDAHYTKKLVRDIVDCHIRYKATPQEYFLMGLEHASNSKRDTFLTDIYRDRYINFDIFAELANKETFYGLARPYFKREVMFVKGENDREPFIDMAMRQPLLFAKPLRSGFGNGACALHVENKEQATTIFDQLLQKNVGLEKGWIVEERIIQSPEMAAWNPDSVNTVRLPSFLVHGKCQVLTPFLRTGRKGCVIDNAGGGGIFANIDPSNGVVITDGFDETGKYYGKHPESQLTYKGFRIPDWEGLLAVAAAIHHELKKHRYIAFDFAHTSHGWVVVEANWGQFVSQYNSKIGIKKEFINMMEDTSQET